MLNFSDALARRYREETTMFDRVPPEGWLILTLMAVAIFLLAAAFGVRQWLDNRKAH